MSLIETETVESPRLLLSKLKRERPVCFRAEVSYTGGLLHSPLFLQNMESKEIARSLTLQLMDPGKGLLKKTSIKFVHKTSSVP